MSQLIDIEDLRRSYLDLYVQVRKYIWSFDTVDRLVDVELECYSAFPDIVSLRSAFSKLRSDIENSVSLDKDKDLGNAIKEFQKILDSDDSYYNLLKAVKEVIVDEDNKESTEGE